MGGVDALGAVIKSRASRMTRREGALGAACRICQAAVRREGQDG